MRVVGYRLVVALSLVLLPALLAACPPNPDNPHGGDPVAMSRAQYDMARDLWLRQGKTREALVHALKAVNLNDKNADAAHLVALIYLDFCEKGPDDCHLKKAEKYTRQALDDRPDFREAKNTLGVILIHEKRYDDAIKVLKPLTADILYATPENAWGNLGWAYLEKGQLDAAIDALQRSVAAQPKFCVGNYRLGRAFEKKKQLESALEAYTNALATDSPACKRLQLAVAGKGRVEMQLGKADQARTDLEQCVKLDRATAAGKECSSMLDKLK